jgi:hypothetical protein
MKKYLYLTGLVSGLFIAATVQAAIYKNVDASGHITYSNVPSKGASRLDIDTPASNGNASGSNAASSPRRAKTPTPANFPRVDQETQTQRDSKRKQILQDELEVEKKALEEAKKAYAEGESVPEVYRAANGKTFRNVPKFEEKMERLKADVATHENNVQLLQKALDAIK